MGELTGKHVLGITVGAFTVIIAVNMLMAFKAVSTFPGPVSYTHLDVYKRQTLPCAMATATGPGLRRI